MDDSDLQKLRAQIYLPNASQEIVLANASGVRTGRVQCAKPNESNVPKTRGLHILTFDPGKTTGWSYWVNRNLVEVGVVMDYRDLLICFGEHRELDVVVYEGFARANASTGDQLQAIEMCGAIQILAVAAKAQLHKQFPANRKGYIPYAKALVKEIAVLPEHKPHVTDAVAHGARYLHKEVKTPWPELDATLSRITVD
jgi:hypothetical protein